MRFLWALVATNLRASVALAWCMAMARDVSGGKVDLADPDTGLGVLDPVLAVLTGGFQLPALTTLSPEFRAAVVLRDLCDLEYDDIAEVLDVPIGTVRSRIARGRAAIAEALGNRSGDSDRPMSRES